MMMLITKCKHAVGVVMLISILLFTLSCQNNEDAELSKRVIIAGKVLNTDKPQYVSLTVQRFGYASECFPNNITEQTDAEGNFYLSFELNTPADACFRCIGGVNININPSDRIYMTIDASKRNQNSIGEVYHFEGSNAQKNNDIVKYYQLLENHPHSERLKFGRNKREPLPDSLRLYLDTLKADYDGLEDYYINTYNPCEEAVAEVRRSFYTTYYHFLTFCPSYYSWKQMEKGKRPQWVKWEIPDFLWEEVKGCMPLSNEDLKYTQYIKECAGAVQVFASREMRKEGTEYSEYIKKYKDSNQKIPSGVNESFYMRWIVNNVEDKMMRQLVLSQPYIDEMSRHSKVKAYEAMLPQLKKYITDPRLIKALDDTYTSALKEIKHKKENPHNLQDYPAKAAENKHVNKILHESNEAYTFITCWSPWIASSVQAVEEIGAQQKALAKKGVNCVYVCFDSDEKSWDKAIGKLNFKGNHYLINGAEVQNLLNFLDLKSVHSSIFLNDAGEIIEKGNPKQCLALSRVFLSANSVGITSRNAINQKSKYKGRKPLSHNELERNHTIALAYLNRIKAEKAQFYSSMWKWDSFKAYWDNNEELAELRDNAISARRDVYLFNKAYEKGRSELVNLYNFGEIELAEYYSSIETLGNKFSGKQRRALYKAQKAANDSCNISTLEAMIEDYHQRKIIFPLDDIPYNYLMPIEANFRDEVVSEDVTY